VLARARVERRINHLKHSSAQAREEESIECYEELFHVVDTDNSGLIDASEFVDLLRLCGYEQELKVKLTEGMAIGIIQAVTKSQYTTEISAQLFLNTMRTGSLGKIVAKKLELVETKTDHGLEKVTSRTSIFKKLSKKTHDKKKANALLQNGQELIKWNAKRKLFNDTFSTPSQILTLLHAPIARMTFQYFDCPFVGDKKYMRADYELECNSARWNEFLIVVIAVLLGVVIGFPLLLSFFLFRFRAELYAPWIHGKVGWLYSRFVRNAEFWEVHEMVRRMVLIGAIVLMPPSPMLRSVICMGICVLTTASLNYHQPYRNKIIFWINQFAEVLALFQYMTTILLNEKFDMQAKDRETLGDIIIVLNVIFLSCGFLAVFANIYLVRRKLLDTVKFDELERTVSQKLEIERMMSAGPMVKRNKVQVVPKARKVDRKKSYNNLMNKIGEDVAMGNFIQTGVKRGSVQL
jgi:hypothetical protein